jgi:hypothetical protein
MKNFLNFRTLFTLLVLLCMQDAVHAQDIVVNATKSVPCGKTVTFSLYKLFRHDYNMVKFPPQSADPSVAQAVGGRKGGGTAGDIDITGGTKPGTNTTTITYELEDFAGNHFTVNVTVSVTCPDLPPPIRGGNNPVPPAPLPRYPAIPATPTHRVARCAACMTEANLLNTVADQLAAAADQLAQDENQLRQSFRNFSWQNYDASMADFQAKQQQVDDDQALIVQLQAELARLARQLDECEKHCVVGNWLDIHPTPVPEERVIRFPDHPDRPPVRKTDAPPAAPKPGTSDKPKNGGSTKTTDAPIPPKTGSSSTGKDGSSTKTQDAPAQTKPSVSTTPKNAGSTKTNNAPTQAKPSVTSTPKNAGSKKTSNVPTSATRQETRNTSKARTPGAGVSSPSLKNSSPASMRALPKG